MNLPDTADCYLLATVLIESKNLQPLLVMLSQLGYIICVYEALVHSDGFYIYLTLWVLFMHVRLPWQLNVECFDQFSPVAL